MTLFQNHDDSELVDQLVGGDREAFEVIYRKYASHLYRFARKNIPLKEDCEEMIQDVFESLWIRHESLEIDSLSSYLFASIRYMIIRYFSKQRLRNKFAEHYQLFESLYDATEKESQNPEALGSIVLEKIQGLPERCQLALRLRLTENLSNADIARRMNISKKTVEFYMSKALNHLRNTLRAAYKGR